MNRIKMKYKRSDGKVNIHCPGCGDDILFEETGIFVKMEGTGYVPVKGFLQPSYPFMSICSNPICKWSSVINE